MQNKKSAIFLGLFYTIFMSLYFCYDEHSWHGIITGAISGVLFGVFTYFFAKSKFANPQADIDKWPHDGSIILTNGANHFKNGESVGGQLYLLQDMLRFKSHRINLQNHELQIPIDKIDTVDT